MKILLVTARNAAPEVRRIAKSLTIPAEVRVCPVDVAALISPEEMAAALLGGSLRGVSEIIVPGSIPWDVSCIAARTKIPCHKGPRNVFDLPEALSWSMSGEIELSASVPADVILAGRSASDVRGLLSKAYGRPERYLFRIGKRKPVYVGAGIGRVVAEIDDAPGLIPAALAERASYLAASGASIIDLGMQAGRDNSERIGDMVECLRSAVDVPLSIDSADPKEILAAADAGIDLVLSVDHRNLHVLDSVSVPCVAIPRDSRGKIPASALGRVRTVERLLSKAQGNKIIADMVLNPLNSGYAESLGAYSLFRERNPSVPMMLGAGNVTELLDADSPGANALLAGYASELGIELLFSVEASTKTRGAVAELARSAEMMYLARRKGQPPKDLGIDLLVLKDKRRRDAFDRSSCGKIPSVRGKMHSGPLEDTEFRIFLDGCICAVCFRKGKPLLRVTGCRAEEVYGEILRRGLAKDPYHAAYLGKELCKAETALRLGKEYVQDADLFRRP